MALAGLKGKNYQANVWVLEHLCELKVKENKAKTAKIFILHQKLCEIKATFI